MNEGCQVRSWQTTETSDKENQKFSFYLWTTVCVYLFLALDEADIAMLKSYVSVLLGLLIYSYIEINYSIGYRDALIFVLTYIIMSLYSILIS